MRLPGGRFMHYFEAQRRYADPSGSCEGVAFAVGWYNADGTAVPSALDLAVRFMSCDYEGATTMLPLAALLDGSRAYWIGQLNARDREWYAVLRVDGRRTAPAVTILTPAGRCGPE